MQFLSTLPARGATEDAIQARKDAEKFLSTLPARGATTTSSPNLSPRSISIHAPREGSDPYQAALPTPRLISIHAPREGSDASRGP